MLIYSALYVDIVCNNFFYMSHFIMKAQLCRGVNDIAPKATVIRFTASLHPFSRQCYPNNVFVSVISNPFAPKSHVVETNDQADHFPCNVNSHTFKRMKCETV